jgi:hypothetical protein
MRELLGKIPTKDPKPSVTGTLRKIHFYIECEEAIEECRLAIIREIFAAMLQQSEPQQWQQDSRLHGLGRPVPSPRHCDRLRNGAEPRQLLAGLSAVC